MFGNKTQVSVKMWHHKFVLVYAICIYASAIQINAKTIYDLTQKVALTLNETDVGTKLSFIRGDVERLSGIILTGSLNVTPIENGFQMFSESKILTDKFDHCYDLRSGEINWYGGPERHSAKWPIEKLTLDGNNPYVLKQSDNFAVAEPYWLNSRGASLYIHRETSLFIDQNHNRNDSVCFSAKLDGPYIKRERVILNYTVLVLDDPKEAHLQAVKTYLKKPRGHPDERMIRQPIWTTWAKYKKAIDDGTVLSFAQDIVNHGFKGGQLEIDDDWEICYGAQKFKTDKFANISTTVKSLKDLDFRVTLWVHPFVDDYCAEVAQEGKDKGYFVKNINGDDKATWWDGNNAHQIDFTNEEARNWYTARLKSLQQNPGIDSFKFDAGETDYASQPSVYNNTNTEMYPNILSESYLRTCAEFGNLIEVRSASGTQDLPVFVRMIDKDSNWGDNNGLYTLITTLLQMNMNGYSMVLPDMVGGNGYNGAPTAELLARWMQANTFMPTMQFSYLPWEITSDQFDGLAIIKKYVNLHTQYADDIIKAMDASINVGTPVNPPIWWVDPTNSDALKVDSEYLLGESILVAPVIEEGATSRDVFLPSGVWKDGNNSTIYTGPITLTGYSAPIDVLPYFIKQ